MIHIQKAGHRLIERKTRKSFYKPNYFLPKHPKLIPSSFGGEGRRVRA